MPDPDRQPVDSSDVPAVTVNRVSFAYNGVSVLDDASFSIRPRQAASIVGPNGGGKTTLVKLMLGLLRPASGSLRLFGGPPAQTRHRVGYMPQQVRFDPQFPVSVLDVVLMGRLGRGGVRGLFGWFDAADRRAARDALGQVGMEDFARRPFAALSGGERQRVLIARALCSQPDLLVLDEPTASVDTLVEARLLGILRELNRRMAVVVVSHDLGFVSSLVDVVVCVNRRVAVHPTRELTGEMIRDLYRGEVCMVRHDDTLAVERGADG
jgi:zinc transport system ATP-binding protein